MKFIFIILSILIPSVSYASVYISEISWMGNANSSNDEFIELYADTETDLTGWTLIAEDGTPNIVLEGSIPTDSYFLLERTDDESVPMVAANQIYTGALGNSGETLILRNASGDVVDRVIGVDNWELIGGDNSTKQTAQKTLSGEWVTAIATPKAKTLENSSSDTNTTSDTSSAVSSVTPIVFHPDMYAYAGGDRASVAGALITFTGRALGSRKEPLKNVRYLWSFGDASVKEGITVEHTYAYPGEYTVVMNVSSGNNTVADRAHVTVVPNKVRITDATEQFVTLSNESSADVDLTNWMLKGGGMAFRFPYNTVIARGAKVSISSAVSGVASRAVQLLYPNNTLAISFSPAAEVRLPQPERTRHMAEAESVTVKKRMIKRQMDQATITALANIVTIGGDRRSGSGKVWWLVSLALGMLGGGAALLVQRNRTLEHSAEQKSTFKRL